MPDAFRAAQMVASTRSEKQEPRSDRAGRPVLYVLGIVAFLIAGAVVHLRTDGIFACVASGYSDDHMLAYCGASGYADYDHAAYWFALEEKAVDSARQAEVLLLGNSRLQMGLSSGATDAWFATAGIEYHLLGFGYDANRSFLEPLLERLGARPEAYVINVDRFFTSAASPPARAAMEDPLAYRQHLEKRFWQALHRAICGRFPSACGREYTIFRARSVGAYSPQAGEWTGTGVSFDEAVSPEELAREVSAARAFLAHLDVPAECVVLTLVPHRGTRQAFAAALARELGHDLVVPPLSDVHLYDGSHLDRPSAERWSAAFLELAGPRLAKCASTG
jgi:hypothetical protein